MRLLQKGVLTLGAVILFGGGVIAANAATPRANNITYSACLSSVTKTLSTVTLNGSPKCPARSRLISWNAQGPTGTPGTPGSLWSFGTTPPVATTTLTDGEIYLDTSTGSIYEYVSGLWSLEGTLEGPQGPAGVRGATGATGPTGAPGNNAADGESCATGQSVIGFDSSGNIECSVPPTLTTQDTQYSCFNDTCSWGTFTGSGLQPGSEVNIYISFNGGAFGDSETSFVLSDGTISGQASLTCSTTPEEIYATGTTESGSTITSNTVSNPCAP
jgi:hypothetical protein